MNIHPMARTTAQLRAEIHDSELSNVELAKKFNVHRHTIAKWRKRDKFVDKSHRPDSLQTTLSVGQELLVVELRKTLFLPLDDLLVVTREFINSAATRSGLQRTLTRYCVSNLNVMRRELEQASGEKQPKKSFKDYAPGFVHIDVKYLPKMSNEKSRRYLFVAIDRATRWVYMVTFANKTAASARRFLAEVIKRAPFKITKRLTDNGKEFTDKLFTGNKERKPTGHHLFDKLCTSEQIEHRLTKPRHPQTNGMVERFNGRIAGILKDTKMDSSEHLEQVLTNYLQIYNHHIPQKNLGHITPIQAMKNWQAKEPGLFYKKVYDLSGLDI